MQAGDVAGQPVLAAIELAARARRLTAHYQPIVSGNVGDADAITFGELLEQQMVGQAETDYMNDPKSNTRPRRASV